MMQDTHIDQLQYEYLRDILEEEFKDTFIALQQAGILHYEVLNLADHCRDVFLSYPTSHIEEDNRLLHYH